MELKTILKTVGPANEQARQEARRRWNSCAKPIGGLGRLETALEDIAALTGSANMDIGRRTVMVLCADNGVTVQGISQSPQTMTGVVAQALAARKTSVCKMAEVARCEVLPVDMGIVDFPGADGILTRRVGNGTGDISCGPAMTRKQAEEAIGIGMELVRSAKERGVRLVATGELGIGNTTTATAVASVLLDRPVEELTGRGGGLSDEGLVHKIEVIRRALRVNQPDREDIVDVLSKVGGFDIAGMCGMYLGGAVYGVPVLIDGVISAAAALCAVQLCPAAAKALLATHVSAEPASGLLLEAVGKKPVLTAQMHLGEGTGAVAAMPLLDMACAVYSSCNTFADCGVEEYLIPGDGQ